MPDRNAPMSAKRKSNEKERRELALRFDRRWGLTVVAAAATVNTKILASLANSAHSVEVGAGGAIRRSSQSQQQQ